MSALRKTRAWVIAAVVLAGLATACGGGDSVDDQTPGPQPGGPRLADQWAGKVDGTNAYISVFTLDNGETGAYLADGDQIAALVLGTLQGGNLDLGPNDDGVTVKGTVADADVTGTTTIDGQEHSFSATRATGEAGWYRGRTTVGGELATAGYIILADGTQRGAVRQGDQVLGAPEFDPSSPTITAGGVSVNVVPVAEFVEREGGLA
jgi:hypothetical protein